MIIDFTVSCLFALGLAAPRSLNFLDMGLEQFNIGYAGLKNTVLQDWRIRPDQDGLP
jgi:hypothetical protein